MKLITLLFILLLAINIVSAQETLLIKETPYKSSCGIDADSNGLKCDPNEDWISCPTDCNFPTQEEWTCTDKDTCALKQAWFTKIAFVVLLATTIYLIYTDMYMVTRKRRIYV